MPAPGFLRGLPVTTTGTESWVMCQKKTAIASEGPDAISLGVSACAAIDRLDNSWLHSGPICQRKGKAETPTRAVLQLVSASGHATGIDSDKGQSFPTDPSAPPSPAQVLQLFVLGCYVGEGGSVSLLSSVSSVKHEPEFPPPMLSEYVGKDGSASGLSSMGQDASVSLSSVGSVEHEPEFPPPMLSEYVGKDGSTSPLTRMITGLCSPLSSIGPDASASPLSSVGSDSARLFRHRRSPLPVSFVQRSLLNSPPSTGARSPTGSAGKRDGRGQLRRQSSRQWPRPLSSTLNQTQRCRLGLAKGSRPEDPGVLC